MGSSCPNLGSAIKTVFAHDIAFVVSSCGFQFDWLDNTKSTSKGLVMDEGPTQPHTVR